MQDKASSDKQLPESVKHGWERAMMCPSSLSNELMGSGVQVLQSKLDKLKESRPGSQLGTEQQELETLRMMVRCSLCNIRTKRSLITRCMHMFCEECLAQWQAKRHRNCPSCKTGFSAQDVKQIYLV